MEKRNREKSGLLYNFIEQSDFYRSPVRYKEQRSVANIPFVSPSPELDAKFNKESCSSRIPRISRGPAA